MELSKKVKALRKKQGLSQLELAEKIFVSRQAISGWEAGTSRPSTENLQCLSKLYAVPLEVLLDDKQELEFGGDKQSEPVIPQKQRKKKCVSIIIGFIIILLFGITLFQFWKKNSVKAKLFCPEIAGLFCRIAGLFCHDSRANLSLKPVCFGIAIS